MERYSLWRAHWATDAELKAIIDKKLRVKNYLKDWVQNIQTTNVKAYFNYFYHPWGIAQKPFRVALGFSMV